MVGQNVLEKSCDEGWAEQELGRADFGDVRLTNRLVKVAESFSARLLALINQASENWAATKSAY